MGYTYIIYNAKLLKFFDIYKFFLLKYYSHIKIN